MKHAAIFTRLAQRADPNIPILEAAMDEISQLEEQLETSGYSPFTEEVEDILRSEIAKRDERIHELALSWQEQAERTKELEQQIADWKRWQPSVVRIDQLEKQIAELKSKNAGFSELAGLMRSSLEGDTKRISELLGERDALAAQNQQLRDALKSIQRYGLDTLSGRTDGPDDREWQRAGVNELTKRARVALSLPDLATPVLNRVKAEALRAFSRTFAVSGLGNADLIIPGDVVVALHKIADAIEKGEW